MKTKTSRFESQSERLQKAYDELMRCHADETSREYGRVWQNYLKTPGMDLGMLPQGIDLNSWKTTGEAEPSCLPRLTHNWAARAFGGVGYIEEKVCTNCGVVAMRTPPLVENNEVVRTAGFSYNK